MPGPAKPARFWDIEDLDDIIKNAPTLSHDKPEDGEFLALNAQVPRFAAAVPTEVTRQNQEHYKRTSRYSRDRQIHHGSTKKRNFDDVKETLLDEHGALTESARCLKCADAPCTRSCPTSIDIKAFIQCITTKNYYGAAKFILDNNPIGLTCGMVCPTSELCVGSCNMAATGLPINISGLQEFACTEFAKMRVPQIRDPSRRNLPDSYKKPIAIVGAGPAGLSCANYLGRLGYSDVHVFEALESAGGLDTYEIPQYRCQYDATRFEVRLCTDLGVKFHYGQKLGKELSLDKLRKDFAAVFLGIGMPTANVAAPFKQLSPVNGVWTSKEFLPAVCKASKPGCVPKPAFAPASRLERIAEQIGVQLPAVGSHTVVLGAGDTAFDAIGSAFRCGAKRVTCIFRKTFSDMRAVYEERELAIKEYTDFVSNALPIQVVMDEAKKVTGLRVQRMDLDGDDGVAEWGKSTYVDDKDAQYVIRCDTIITCFGCHLDDTTAQLLAPGTVAKGVLQSDEKFAVKGAPGVFAGGDLTGATMVVEAANDGKIASWWMHEHIQGTPLGPPQLPRFYTPIDDVDVSITMSGIKFPNPFGLASAPPCTTAAMIRRAFEAGWGFAVTKTFGLDQDLVTNVSPRIVRGTYNAHYGPHQPGFINIELITEKTAAYWLKSIHELKRDFPDKIVVASIMAGYVEADWKKLVELCCQVGSDIVELNLSCPHGMGEAGMGLACGQEPEMVRNITRWCKEAAAATKTPIFSKLTNNITEIAVIARAVKEGGGDGVTAINTLHGILDVDPKGETWPKIGKEKLATSGGVCGDVNRPSTTRAIWSISQFAPGLEIMATGGISSAASAMQMLNVGAQTVQICSAVQNQDFSVIDDYMTGLKTMLYLQGRGDMDGVTYQNNWKSRTAWAGTAGADQTTPPALRKAGEAGVLEADARVPKLGMFNRDRAAARRKFWDTHDPALVKGEGGVVVDDIEALPVPKRVPALGEQVGLTHRKHIRSHNDLSRDDQVVAVINDDMCINCGKCYLTCNDSGYQAIRFDEKSHIPKVDEDRCTGCGLCQAVCPAPGTIEYIPMGRRFEPKRGLEVKLDRWREGGEALVKKVTINPN